MTKTIYPLEEFHIAKYRLWMHTFARSGYVLLLLLMVHINLFSQVVNLTQTAIVEGGFGKQPNVTGANVVTANDNYAYVVGTGNVLQIIDITLSGLPVPRGSIANGDGGALINQVKALAVQGNYVYMTSQGSNALEIVDVSDPAKPIHKGSISDGGGNAPYLKNAWGLAVAGDYAYVGSEYGLEIIDISNPASPKHKGIILDGGLNDGFPVAPYLANIVQVEVVGNYAYTTNLGKTFFGSGLQIVDISNPANPIAVGSLRDNGFAPSLFSCYGLVVKGQYAYTVDAGRSIFGIIDISNPYLPVSKSSLTSQYINGPFDVAVEGNYAYVCNVGYYTETNPPSFGGAIAIIDISNPANPVDVNAVKDEFVGGIREITYNNSKSLVAVGTKVFATTQDGNALHIIDVTNPPTATRIASVKNGSKGALMSGANSVTIAKNHAFVTSRYDNSLEIIDITNPAQPKHKVSANANSINGALFLNPNGVVIDGDYAYVINELGYLEILNIRDLSNPYHEKYVQLGSNLDYFPKAITNSPGPTLYIITRKIQMSSGWSGNNALMSVFLPMYYAEGQIPMSIIKNGDGGAFLKHPSSIFYHDVPNNGKLLVTNDSTNTLEVFSANGLYMNYLGKISDGEGGGAKLKFPVSVVTSGNLAYVVSKEDKALEIIDFSDPANMLHVGSIADGQGGAMLTGANTVRVSGKYAYITCDEPESGNGPRNGRIEVINISNPAAPVYHGRLGHGTNGALLDSPNALAISGNYVYVTNSGSLTYTGLYENLNIAYLYGPSLDSFSPATGPVGTPVTIAGKNFTTFLTATVNGLPAKITSLRENSLTFIVPPSASNGKVVLTYLGQNFSAPTNFIVTPSAAAVTDVQQQGFSAGWTNVGSSEYFLDVSTDNFNTFVPGYNNRSVGNTTSQAITGLNSGTIYQYRVRSSDGAAVSSNSNIITVLTIPATPIATAATELTQSGFRANWTSVVGATSYVIDVAYDEAFTSFIVGYNNLSVLNTSTSQLVSGLSSYTKCYYRVRALSAGGSSPSSNRIEALTLDTIDPIIAPAGTPNATTVTSGNTPILNALITDNVGINLAEIFYRGISETSFKKATMQGPGGVGGNYSITIQSNWYDQMGLEYYFKASDKAGNETVSQTNFIQLVTPSITVPALPSGSTQNDYRIIAFPFQLTTDNKVSTVYSGIPWNDNTKAAIWWWNSSAQDGKGAYDQYGASTSFQTIDQGKGYWAITSTSFAPQLSNVAAPKFNRSNLYSMTLKPNWNLIGNPYPLSISWDEVIAFNLINGINVFSPLSVYDGTGYKVATGDLFLKPFEGGFVKNLSSSDITIQIPFPGQLTGGRAETISSDISQDSWNVFMHIDQNNLTNQLGGFGMHPEAISGQDRYDHFNPPSFLEMPSVIFTNSKFASTTFSKDMVKSEADHIWQFAPTGTIGQTAQLHWSPEIVTGSSRQLFLLDEEHLNVIDMLSVHHYNFTLTKNSKFRIFYGSNIQTKITTQNVAVGAPYPNPLMDGAAAKINLALPDLSDVYQISVQLYNSRGEIIEAANKTLNPGIHQLEFSDTTQSLTSGMYVYKIAVSSNQSSTVYTGKIVKP